MNHLSNLNVDPMKFAKSISDENNKTIKELFKDKINGSINAKLKMYKNANSKCTILAKHRLEEYTPLWRCEYERAKGHFREGEAFNEREF